MIASAKLSVKTDKSISLGLVYNVVIVFTLSNSVVVYHCALITAAVAEQPIFLLKRLSAISQIIKKLSYLLKLQNMAFGL